jgi:hypothetical protein
VAELVSYTVGEGVYALTHFSQGVRMLLWLDSDLESAGSTSFGYSLLYEKLLLCGVDIHRRARGDLQPIQIMNFLLKILTHRRLMNSI